MGISKWVSGNYNDPLGGLKVARHLCFKNSKNLQLLDVQACNSADGLLAELTARMSLGRRFLPFLKQRCLVTLRCQWGAGRMSRWLFGWHFSKLLRILRAAVIVCYLGPNFNFNFVKITQDVYTELDIQCLCPLSGLFWSTRWRSWFFL